MQLHNNIKLIKKFQQVALQVKLFQSRNVLKRYRSHADSIFLRQDTSRLVNSESFKKTPQKFCLFGYELIVEFNVKRFCNCKCRQGNNQYNLVRNCEDRNVIPYLFIRFAPLTWFNRVRVRPQTFTCIASVLLKSPIFRYS